MQSSFEPPADFALQLPRDAYWQLVHTLHNSLPPPVSDDPADIARRDNAAIAAAASLLPVTPAEARLAAQFVAADAQAHECLRLSRLYPADLPVAMKCNAQSGCMMRQSQGALRALQRMQEARRKRDSDPVAADRAVWAEHCAAGFMTEALHGEAVALSPHVMQVADPPATPDATAAEEAEPARDPLKEAEFYAALYPRRATEIRCHGGMPPNAGYPPPEDDILGALVNGRTDALFALDRQTEISPNETMRQRCDNGSAGQQPDDRAAHAGGQRAGQDRAHAQRDHLLPPFGHHHAQAADYDAQAAEIREPAQRIGQDQP